MPMTQPLAAPAGAKFQDPERTAAGEPRARVRLSRIETLWFNTGTLCNIACPRCYIESSPRNDRLAYLSAAEVAAYLDELDADGAGPRTIGFTGGEPFMNRELAAMLADALGRGHSAMVLTNAMAPLRQARRWLAALNAGCGGRLRLRVSLDHWSAAVHDGERGAGAFAQAVEGMEWLAAEGIGFDVAGRHFTAETDAELRAGFAALFARHRLPVDADDPTALILFPEMDVAAEVPEITTGCWDILGKSPDEVMCASSRMIAKRRGADRPVVLACTLLAYDERFELGPTLADAAREVALNHPHCAKFCVLGGGSCRR